MTITDVNVAVAKAKGWTEVSTSMKSARGWSVDCGGVPPHRSCVEEALPDYCGDPREWSQLLEEIPYVFMKRHADGWTCYHDESLGPVVRYASLGMAVCCAWLAWKRDECTSRAYVMTRERRSVLRDTPASASPFEVGHLIALLDDSEARVDFVEAQADEFADIIEWLQNKLDGYKESEHEATSEAKSDP